MTLNFHDEVRLHELMKKLSEKDDDLAKESLYFIELLKSQVQELKDENEELEEDLEEMLNNYIMN